MTVKLVRLNREILNLTWEWLNDEEIKRLTNSRDFSREEQINWYNDLSKKMDYKIWGINWKGEIIGVCGIKNITKTVGEYWGYIGIKRYWGMGLGQQILKETENKAIEIGILRLYLIVLVDNIRAINSYFRSGYKIEHMVDGKYKMMKILHHD
jgi:RimJ/RimL family protein N-acetyltransferase